MSSNLKSIGTCSSCAFFGPNSGGKQGRCRSEEAQTLGNMDNRVHDASFGCVCWMKTMSAEEQEAQRRSFVYGNGNIDNPDITRELVSEYSPA